MEEQQSAAVDAESQEMISFGIVASAGEARSLAFEALKAARDHDFDMADELLARSKKAALGAHRAQTALLSREADGDHTPVDVLLVHAQDHLMTSMLAQELIAELIYLHRAKQDRKVREERVREQD
ncbi:PTS system N,N'-diacetylchitobiose-specific IIA component, Lac family [Coriobacterium glomerans PW2]|uniref:PTS system N,N'-diacetylchitobiose-specific IIA component, Lac family n=1 Tax=Coriobacterium glomerans (strain ATCC 49209 / DSM 20642 / JCM 10262 / PW2) TaxID=700015 RepID=F2NAZ4_CORGP|nr:PTS lactose/cellobiose transporter subunit IIA [Coriobacterium glomerans]AEB07672.1 PTS system N,N'-diacetylchitobiose-specific IIA component, Lac family [Coriobacterium glomerans PW2]